MRKLSVIGIIGIVLVVGVLLIQKSTTAQTPPSLPAAQDGPAGSISPDADAPDALTSFNISNPYCYQPDPSVDQCYINFRYIQATDNQSSAPYMTWLTIKISGKTRYSATAFFEGTIYYSYDMMPAGMQVPCGAPNASGAGDQFGFVYGVVITPLDSSRNPMSTDIANLTCPAYAP